VVVKVGGGIMVVVRDIVLHATVMVDGEIVVDPTLVDVYVEAGGCEYLEPYLDQREVLTDCIRCGSDADGD
jgi:hypothetical protein